MTRVTIELGTMKCSVENQSDELDINEVLEMVESAMKGVGFVLDGELDVVKKDCT